MIGEYDRIHRLQRIVDTQAAIVQADLDLDRFMQLIVDTLQDLTQSKSTIVELVDGEFMVYRCASSDIARHVGLRLRRDGSLSGLCVSTGDVLRCDDAETDSRVDKEACARVGVRSMICTPLFQRGVAVGVLKIMSGSAYAFDDADVQTLNLFGGMLGAALGKQLAFDALQRAETRIRVILENASDAVISINGAGVILRWNRAAELLFGWATTEALGRNIASLGKTEGHPGIATLFASANDNSALTSRRTELVLRARDGRQMIAELHLSHNQFGDAHEITAFVHDISERKHLEESLISLAQTDTLTGLPNRRKIMEVMSQAIARARRRDLGMALLFMDMNGFKRINDQFGHEIGDQALREFSRRIQSCVRETDTVGRLGGDEFIVIAEGIDSVQQAFVLANKIVAVLKPVLPELQLQLATSIGISLYHAPLDADQWISEADAAMYQAKQQQSKHSNRIMAVVNGQWLPGL